MSRFRASKDAEAGAPAAGGDVDADPERTSVIRYVDLGTGDVGATHNNLILTVLARFLVTGPSSIRFDGRIA